MSKGGTARDRWLGAKNAVGRVHRTARNCVGGWSHTCRCGRGAILCRQPLSEQSEEGKGLVGTFLLGSVALSLPFFYKNVLRLGTKITSGGKDDGYGK